MMKLLEGNEEKAQANYAQITAELPNAKQILADESKHEKLLIWMIDEKRLKYLSSIISGLNDALITLGIGALSFVIGWIVKTVLNL